MLGCYIREWQVRACCGHRATPGAADGKGGGTLTITHLRLQVTEHLLPAGHLGASKAATQRRDPSPALGGLFRCQDVREEAEVLGWQPGL